MSAESEHFTQVVEEVWDIDPAFPPSLIYSYQNLGMTLLGHMVQAVDGRPYEAYIGDEIFEPIGMNHSYMAPTLRADAHSSKSYLEGTEITDPALRGVPTGGLQTTVLDMSRFAQMLFADGQVANHRVVQPETLKETFRPQNTSALDFGHQTGLGWDLEVLLDQRAGVIASKDGGTGLFFSEFHTLPEHKLAVVVMSNSATGLVELTARLDRGTLCAAFYHPGRHRCGLDDEKGI